MKLSKSKWLIILGAVLVVIDQIFKILVKTNMTYGQIIPVIGNWFNLCFIENEGMAFGMKFGGVVGKYILTIFRIVLSGFLCWWISSLAKKNAPTGVLVGLTLIAAGALGNVIDCLFYGLIFTPSGWDTAVATFGGHYAPFMQGKVVDMLYFPIIDTYWPDWMPFVGGRHFTFFDPVFNFADSCVTVGAFYLVLFKWRFFASEADGDSKQKAEKKK